MSSSGPSRSLAASILEALGFEGGDPTGHEHLAFKKHGVSLLTLCPLGQPKKAIGLESQIEPWLTPKAQPLRLPSFQKSTSEFKDLLSLYLDPSRTAGRRPRDATPRRPPPPGRSEQHSLYEVKQGSETTLGEHGHTHNESAKREGVGLDAKPIALVQLGGEAF